LQRQEVERVSHLLLADLFPQLSHPAKSKLSVLIISEEMDVEERRGREGGEVSFELVSSQHLSTASNVFNPDDCIHPDPHVTWTVSFASELKAKQNFPESARIDSTSTRRDLAQT